MTYTHNEKTDTYSLTIDANELSIIIESLKDKDIKEPNTEATVKLLDALINAYVVC